MDPRDQILQPLLLAYLVELAEDEYVVCRIFQKSGAGPQNGAPFVEKEWENDDNMLLLPSVDGVEQQFSAPGCCQQSTQADDDFAQESKDVLILNGNDGQLAVPDDGMNSLSSVAFDNGQNIFDHPVVPNEVHENQESIDTMDQNIDLCWLNDEERFGMDQNYGLQELHQDQGFPEDDYLELKDLTASPHGGYSCVQDSSNQLPGIRNNQVSTRFSQVTNLPELHGVEEFFNSTNGNANLQEPIGAFSPFETNFDLGMNEMLNPVMGDYLSGEQTDDGRGYYDAPNHNLAADHGGFIEMNDFLYPTISGSSTSDPVDELMAYFDATDNHLQLSYLENPERADSSSLDQVQSDPEVVGGNALPQASGASIEKGASSTTPLVGDETTIRSDDLPVAQGVQSRKDWDKTITGRLVGVLGSMPAPPALAAEHPMKGAKSLNFSTSACSSTSVHITAGMIHIDALTVTESGKQWSVHKSQDVDFLLSYGMVRSHFGSNTEKMHDGVISLVIRSGFRLLFLSILFLALSFKMAICIYSR